MSAGSRLNGSVGRGLLFAPLAAPLAVFIGAIVANVIHRPVSAAPNTIGAIAFAGWVIVLVGTPPAYAATLLVLWPASRVLARSSAFTWWSAALCGGAVGVVVMPLYLHLLEPHGNISLFPSAGLVAGLASGVCFWWLTRPAAA